jgi:hypothetical protein
MMPSGCGNSSDPHGMDVDTSGQTESQQAEQPTQQPTASPKDVLLSMVQLLRYYDKPVSVNAHRCSFASFITRLASKRAMHMRMYTTPTSCIDGM